MTSTAFGVHDPSASSLVTFDREGYFSFKAQTTRYEVLPDSILGVLGRAGISDRGQRQRYLLSDLGCGDLTLTGRLLPVLEALVGTPLTADLVDNDPEMLRRAQAKAASWAPGLQPGLAFHEVDVQDYLPALSRGSRNFLLCSHLLYHLPLASWRAFLDLAIAKLAKDGLMIVVLRSSAGQWWSVFDRVMAPVRSEFRRSHRFAEDLDLSRLNCTHSLSLAHYPCTPADSPQLLAALEFLYRLPAGRIARDISLRRNSLAAAEPYRGPQGYRFFFSDAIVVLRK